MPGTIAPQCPAFDTRNRPKSSETLKAAGNTTLKLGTGGYGPPDATQRKTSKDQATFLKPGANFHSDGVPFPDLMLHVTKSRKDKSGNAPKNTTKRLDMVTVYDQPDSKTLQQTKVLDTLGSKVVNMSSSFEEVTRMKAGKAEMMNEMHQHALDKVEETRVHMEKLLAEIQEQIGKFTDEWTGRRCDRMDELDKEMRERVAELNAWFKRLEERAMRLNAAIEEETASRIRDTEALMIPVNKTVERLTADLETEREIRENRQRELMQHLEESVKMLEDANATEAKNRVDRHAESVKEYTKEYERLQARHDQIGEKSFRLISNVQEDLKREVNLRVEGQDNITSQINDFITRFQKHVLEEGDAGN